MPGPYEAIVFTGDVPGAGTDEDVLIQVFGEVQGQVIFIGNATFSGEGDALERGADGHNGAPDIYENVNFFGSLLDATSCGIKLTQKGTERPDWYCIRIEFNGGDLGRATDANAQVAVIEFNDWVRYGQGYAFAEVKLEPLISYLRRPMSSIPGPRRLLNMSYSPELIQEEPPALKPKTTP